MNSNSMQGWHSLEKSLNSIFSGKVLKFLCNFLECRFIFYNFEVWMRFRHTCLKGLSPICTSKISLTSFPGRSNGKTPCKESCQVLPFLIHMIKETLMVFKREVSWILKSLFLYGIFYCIVSVILGSVMFTVSYLTFLCR